MQGEQLAVMRKVGFGNYDHGHFERPALFFEAELISGGALIILPREQACAVIAESGVWDVKNLEGAPCVVARDAEGVRFVRLHR